jgi:hypothetical protein
MAARRAEYLELLLTIVKVFPCQRLCILKIRFALRLIGSHFSPITTGLTDFREWQDAATDDIPVRGR